MKLLVKSKKLSKANRANLVKVSVQVNGKNGTYQSHRWKNPTAAMEILKEGMKKQGLKNAESLEFTDKKTGKKLNEEQLLEEYKSSKSNGTLQDFVKENYSVGNGKKNKKENKTKEKKTDNKKEKAYTLEEAFEALNNLELKQMKIPEGRKSYVAMSQRQKMFNEFKKEVAQTLNQKTIKQKDLKRIVTLCNIFSKKSSFNFWDESIRYGVDNLDKLIAYSDGELKEHIDNPTRSKNSKNSGDKPKKEIDPGVLANIRKLRRDTRKIEGAGTYEPVKSMESFVDKMKSFKDSNVNVKARAAMDMFSIDIPLYVRQDGTNFEIGKNNYAAGYVTRYTYNNRHVPKEMGIAKNSLSLSKDEAKKRLGGIKETSTIVHENMHVMFSKTINNMIDNKLENRKYLDKTFEESAVEMVALSSIDKIYGGNEGVSKIPSYLDYILSMAPILKTNEAFSDTKTIRDMGKILGEKLFEGDGAFFESLGETYKNEKRDSTKSDIIVKETKDKLMGNLEHYNEEAKNRYSGSRENTQTFDELIRQLDSGMISIDQALNSANFREAAALLLFVVMDDDEELPLF